MPSTLSGQGCKDKIHSEGEKEMEITVLAGRNEGMEKGKTEGLKRNNPQLAPPADESNTVLSPH